MGSFAVYSEWIREDPEHGEVVSLYRLLMDQNPSVFCYLSSPGMVHWQYSLKLFLSQDFSPECEPFCFLKSKI